MIKIQEWLTSIINISLKILFFILIIGTFLASIFFLPGSGILNICFFMFFLASGAGLWVLIKKKISADKLITLIVIYGFVIRMLWVLSINSIPASDFEVMYNQSTAVLRGEYYIFRGSAYFARFPHLTITVLYFAFIRNFFSQPLVVLKIINIISSTSVIFLCYIIAKEVFNSKTKAIWTGFVAAIYPPVIIYSAVYCSENIAIPFYLLSVYIFILAIKNKKPRRFLLLSAVSLSIGNLFRMVAPVMLIAFIMYTLIYTRQHIKSKVISSVYLASGFLIPLLIVSNLLLSMGITEFQLWKGSESPWTSILKGTNLSTYGRFNSEDAVIVDKYNYDYYKVENACKEIVKERLTTTPVYKLAAFFVIKYAIQWAEGDCGGILWANKDLGPKDMKVDLNTSAHFYVQLFYLTAVIFTYKGLFNKKQYLENPIINLFYIIYCGYGLLYLITESQSRYSFIVSWLFIILPFTAFKDDRFFEEIN